MQGLQTETPNYSLYPRPKCLHDEQSYAGCKFAFMCCLLFQCMSLSAVVIWHKGGAAVMSASPDIRLGNPYDSTYAAAARPHN